LKAGACCCNPRSNGLAAQLLLMKLFTQRCCNPRSNGLAAQRRGFSKP